MINLKCGLCKNFKLTDRETGLGKCKLNKEENSVLNITSIIKAKKKIEICEFRAL